MAANQAQPENIIARFYFTEKIYRTGKLPTPGNMRIYMSTLMSITAADGMLTEKQRKWVMSLAATCGASEELLDRLRNFEPGNDDVSAEYFQDVNASYVKKTRQGVVFQAFEALYSTGELDEAKIKAIYGLADKLGLTENQVRELEDFAKDEYQRREKLINLLFPDGNADIGIEFKPKT